MVGLPRELNTPEPWLTCTQGGRAAVLLAGAGWALRSWLRLVKSAECFLSLGVRPGRQLPVAMVCREPDSAIVWAHRAGPHRQVGSRVQADVLPAPTTVRRAEDAACNAFPSFILACVDQFGKSGIHGNRPEDKIAEEVLLQAMALVTHRPSLTVECPHAGRCCSVHGVCSSTLLSSDRSAAYGTTIGAVTSY
jgi:hypothetical protein